MKIHLTIVSIMLAAASLTTFEVKQSVAQQSREVILGGYNIEPTVRTSGSGLVNVSLKKDTLIVDGDFSNLVSPYLGAYIMIGKKDETGNMLHRLKVEPSEDRTGGTITAKANRYKLSDAQQALMKNGELYINITSEKYRKGELRGRFPAMK